MIKYLQGFEMMEIKLKSVRVRHNMTIESLAEISGVSKSHISDIETGQRMPTIKVLCKLAKALGVSPEELYDC